MSYYIITCFPEAPGMHDHLHVHVCMSTFPTLQESTYGTHVHEQREVREARFTSESVDNCAMMMSLTVVYLPSDRA